MGKKGATTEEERIDNCLVYLDLTFCVSVSVCERGRNHKDSVNLPRPDRGRSESQGFSFTFADTSATSGPSGLESH